MSQFTVEHIWPLDPTKKSGGFKGADGVNYYCEIGAYGMLTKGTTYDAPVTPYVSKAGKQSFIVDKKWHPPATVVGNGAAPAQQAAAPTVPTQAAAGNGMARQSNIDGKDFTIFVTGVVGRAMGSGQFGVTDIDLLTKAAIAAYKDNIA